MKTNLQALIVIVLLTFLCFTHSLFSQSKSETDLPPWITGSIPGWKQGNLPPFHIGSNRYNVIFSEDKLPEIAEHKAERQLVSAIAKRKGVNVSTTEEINTAESRVTVLQDNKAYEGGRSQTNYTSNLIIDGKAFAKYALLDKHTQYKGGIYYFAALYLVAEEEQDLVSLPPVSYSMDKGAWRSLILPGWSQFYTGQTGKGLVMLVGEAGFIGTTLYMDGRLKFHKNRMQEANSIEIKQFHKKQYDNFFLYRNITGGAVIGWYLYNVIDAFSSKRGKLKYNTMSNYQISIAPTMLQDMNGGVAAVSCSINF